VTERSAAELQDEARLIEAAKRDRKAFGALYDRYFDQIYSYCYYHSGRREEAEDLASETFQRALEGLDNFEWRGIPYSAWLYKVASNLMSKRRRRPPWIELPDPIAGSGENDPERLWLRREQGDELHKAVQKLPLDQREAVLLKFEGRLKNKEIGVIMGRSGVGKSVSLKHIMGFLKADSGQIFIDGEDVTEFKEADFAEVRRKVTMVFQSGALHRGDVNEHVAAAVVRLDEAIAALAIEEFDYPCHGHRESLPRTASPTRKPRSARPDIRCRKAWPP